MSDCYKKNDLVIPGTRQDERLPLPLDPQSVLVDERKMADLMVFITKYAGLLNYYSATEPNQSAYKIDGDWQSLILSDEAFNYAGISVTKFILPNISFYRYIHIYETESTAQKRFNAYRVWWDIIVSVYNDINIFYKTLPAFMPLRSFIGSEIMNNLRADLGNLAGAYLNAHKLNAALTIAIANPPRNLHVASPATDDSYKFGFANDILSTGFDPLWIDPEQASGATAWGPYLAFLNTRIVLADVLFQTNSFVAEFDRIDYSTVQLKQYFRRAFEAYSRIVVKAEEFLRESLEYNSSHYAHHGLLLAFLKLFGLAQQDMNEFTRKHLEYYYQRVLKLLPAPATPDVVHIVFEPAKNTVSHLIKKGTELNAGKDGAGKLLLYETSNEIVINQSKIAELKTIYAEPSGSAAIHKVYASPQANTADGKGAAFTGDDTSWKAFADNRADGIPPDPDNVATIGFYIAAPVLHLSEGERTINISFDSDSAGVTQVALPAADDWTSLFKIYTTGEKGWDQLDAENSEIVFTGSSFSLEIVLKEHYPSVLGYDETVHKEKLATKYPVFKFVLNQETADAYQALRDIVIYQVNITVTADKMVNLALVNEAGMLDAAKPVSLFGPLPKKNSVFYIGHPELEHKIVSAIYIALEWQDLPSSLLTHYSYLHPAGGSPITYSSTPYISGITNNNSFTITAQFFRNKEWIPVSPAQISLFSSSPVSMTFAAGIIKPAVIGKTVYDKKLAAFSPETRDGFVSLTLAAPADAFGHSKWAQVFAQQTVAMSNDSDTSHNSLPNPPYTPVLKSIKLKYTASATITFSASYDAYQGMYFHLLPFGNKDMQTGVYLLPRFDMLVKMEDGSIDTNPVLFESALIIGISNAGINQNISMLLQVNEGTEDISVEHTDVNWNYLSTEGWKHFDKRLLADNTNNLLKSGIVTVQVPVDPEMSATELSSGIFWIRAGLQSGSMGLPKMLAVYTNAVEAVFADHGNDPSHLEAALLPNTISKLFNADGDVKKLAQPYASFGGKMTESGKKYYTRVSERLRHKHRAITIWDYERIALNQFPEVYMIKCLNHTGYEITCCLSEDDACEPTKKYKENIPGSVMLVPVPFVTNLQGGNKFQPKFSQSKLDDIKNYIHGLNDGSDCHKDLKALHCELADLIVENPEYETISVSCDIKVKPCLDALFYAAQLSDDLDLFLSPWINGDEGKINFGGSLHRSLIIYFIEQLPYINYLENLEITHRDKNGIILNAADPTLAVTQKSCSILTSSGSHNINPI